MYLGVNELEVGDNDFIFSGYEQKNMYILLSPDAWYCCFCTQFQKCQ